MLGEMNCGAGSYLELTRGMKDFVWLKHITDHLSLSPKVTGPKATESQGFGQVEIAKTPSPGSTTELAETRMDGHVPGGRDAWDL